MKPTTITTLFFLMLLNVATATAQTQRLSKVLSSVDFGFGIKQKNAVAAISFSQYLELDRRGLFQVSWGLRMARFMGQNVPFTTAPPLLTTGKGGLSAVGAPIIGANIDTLFMPKAQLTSLNFMVGVQLQVGIVNIGANADIFGLALAGSRIGTFASNESIKFNDSPQTATTMLGNIRLLGDNNRGNLNAEIYARVWIAQQVGIKIGYFFSISEYQTAEKNLPNANDRFRFRQSTPYISISLPIYN